MSRNLHIADAKFRQNGVHDWQSEEGSTDATNIAAILDAHVEATLALVYEQQTANLIAYQANVELSYIKTEAKGQRSSAAEDLNHIIRERLGL